jgi:hypothetical protein
MKTYGVSRRVAQTFMKSALGWAEWSASRSDCFTLRKRASGNHWIGGWVGLRVGLDAVEPVIHVIHYCFLLYSVGVLTISCQLQRLFIVE